jgi:hypothetical protein
MTNVVKVFASTMSATTSGNMSTYLPVLGQVNQPDLYSEVLLEISGNELA